MMAREKPSMSEGGTGRPRVVGIVPARGGSKGLPRKNLIVLAGQPLILYTLRSGSGSRMVDRLLVSTDDEEIAEVVAGTGVEVMVRDPALGADDTPTADVVRDVLRRLADGGDTYEIVVLLQPTSPLRSAADIDGAVRLLIEGGADSVVTVTRVEDAHPARMYRELDGLLVPYAEESRSRRRQDLEPVFHRNGAVYATWVERFLADDSLTAGRLVKYEMPRGRSVNIDDRVDLALAAALLAMEEKA